MLSQIQGLHHVTSLASGAQRNNAFFTRTLAGLATLLITWLFAGLLSLLATRLLTLLWPSSLTALLGHRVVIEFALFAQKV